MTLDEVRSGTTCNQQYSQSVEKPSTVFSTPQFQWLAAIKNVYIPAPYATCRKMVFFNGRLKQPAYSAEFISHWMDSNMIHSEESKNQTRPKSIQLEFPPIRRLPAICPSSGLNISTANHTEFKTRTSGSWYAEILEQVVGARLRCPAKFCHR